jgi:hypothetical protein
MLMSDRFGITELAKQHDVEAHRASSFEKGPSQEIREDTVQPTPATRIADDKEVKI